LIRSAFEVKKLLLEGVEIIFSEYLNSLLMGAVVVELVEFELSVRIIL